MFKLLHMAVVICALTISSVQAKTYIRDYTYKASDNDSKVTSRTNALDQVKLILLQEIGTHIRQEINISKDDSGNSYASEDVEAITAGLTKVEIVEEKWNGETYYLKAQIEADTSKVMNALSEFKKSSNTRNLEFIKENQKLRHALREKIKLLNKLMDEESDKEIVGQYNASVDNLAANEIYENAWGLDAQGNYYHAAKLYDKAAKQGHVISQTRLGFMYMIGKGVKQNDTLAAHWIKTAVDQDHPVAKSYLGDLYAEGIGVPYDLNTAVYWYKEAAKNDVREAMLNLSVYFSTPEPIGTGYLPRNQKLSNYWRNKADKLKKREQ